VTDQVHDAVHPLGLTVRQEVGRKLIHLLGLSLPLAYVTLGRDVGILLMLVGCVVIVGADVARLFWSPAQVFYDHLFGKLTRKREERRLTGASVLMLGQTATALVFPPSVVPVAMTFGVLGDVAAALVGRRFGHVHWYQGKSVAGSLACLVASFFGGFVWCTLPPVVVLAGAFAAALAEGFLVALDDNLTIPLLGGLVMWALVA